MSGEIVVVARWQVVPGALAEVRDLVADVRTRSLEEPGCLGYEVLAADGDESAIVLVERYRDEAAVEAHRASAHYRDLVVARIVPKLTSRRVEVLRPF